MFVLLAAAAIAAQATPAPPTPLRGNVTIDIEYSLPPPKVRGDGEDIVVVARSVRRGRASTRTDRRTGARSCAVRRSFGIPTLDAGLCRHVLACIAISPTRPAVRDCVLPRFARDLEALYSTPNPNG